MKSRIRRTLFYCLLSLFSLNEARASLTSYRSTHPIGWMHGLPTGESPGWIGKNWLNTELQWGNYWNTIMNVYDRHQGDTYTFAVDFEQLMFQLEAGYALSKSVSVSAALPIVGRFGGILDQPLDDWHIFVGADRFRRNQFPKNQNNFLIQKNGNDLLASNPSDGLSAFVLKLKWWLLQREDSSRPEMEGLAFSVQTRLPLRGASSGLTTGNSEASFLIHGGRNLSTWGHFWMTAGFTKLAANPVLQGWPTRQWAQLYEAWFEFPLYSKWDFIFQIRYESPILNKDSLEFMYVSTSPKTESSERTASGWNGLTAWRGSEALGLRYRLEKQKSITLLFQEDWALGDNDGRNNFLYVHGTPDVSFVAQMNWGF